LSACGSENKNSIDTIDSSLDLNNSNREQASENEINSSTSISNEVSVEENEKLAYIASSEEAYTHLGIKRDKVEPWEDAMRTSGKSGNYEWWYSDFIFSDGTTVAVSFYSKFLFDTYGSALPLVTINIVYPDGRKINSQDLDLGKKLNASKTFTDVHVKSSFLTYEDGNYHLHYSKDNLLFDATMVSTLPMWRPETGHIYFGESENYFAWLPAQASSTVHATIQENGIEKKLVGSGYHDHNWGNSPLHENINNWYWGRAKVGEYSLIFSDIIAEEEYGYERVPILMVAKGDEILELNGTIEIERKELITDKTTEKSYANKFSFTQKGTNGKTYTIESTRKKDITFVDMNNFPFEAGNRPMYLRSLSDVILTIEGNGTDEEYKGIGIIEQMSFNDNVENSPKSR
jgi:hypothetical protein